eukprot:6484742-Amphidinium_carterae.1
MVAPTKMVQGHHLATPHFLHLHANLIQHVMGWSVQPVDVWHGASVCTPPYTSGHHSCAQRRQFLNHHG